MLGTRIHMIRKEAKIPQHMLANGIISVSHLSNLEANRYNASKETILLLAKRLNVDPHYLINYSKEDNLLKGTLSTFLRETILNASNAIQIVKDIELPIENLELEIVYHLLKVSLSLKQKSSIDPSIENSENYIHYYIDYLKDTYDSHSLILKQSLLYYLGIKNFRENNFSKSNEYFKKLYNLLAEDELKASMLYNIALINYKKSNKLEAYKTTNEALNIYINLQLWIKVAELYNFLGVLYREENLLYDALEYFKKGINISTQMNLISPKDRIYHNMGLIMEDMGNFNEAIRYLMISYNIKKKTNSNLFVTLYCLIRCYIKINDLDLATKTIKEVLLIIENQQQYYLLKGLEAEIHYMKNEYELSIDKLKNTINYLTTHNYIKELLGLNQKMADYYYSKKKYKFAAFYYEKELQIINKLKKG